MLLFNEELAPRKISSINLRGEQHTYWQKKAPHDYAKTYAVFNIPHPNNPNTSMPKAVEWLGRQHLGYDAHRKGTEIKGCDGVVNLPIFTRDIHFTEIQKAKYKRRGQKVPYGAKNFGVASLNAMYKHLVYLSPLSKGGPCYYQMVMKKVPCKLYVDVDVEVSEDFYFDGAAFSKLFEYDLRKYLTDICGLGKVINHKNPDTDEYTIELWRLDASRAPLYYEKELVRPGKWSSHFILQMAFYNSFHVGYLMRNFLKWIVKRHGKPEVRKEMMTVEYPWGTETKLMDKNTNMYFLEANDEKSSDGFWFAPAMDMSVYTADRSFRTLGGCKVGDPSRLFMKAHSVHESSDSIQLRRETLLSTAKQKGRYEIKRFDFIGSSVYDPLFNAMWKEYYGEYVAVCIPGTKTIDDSITAVGVSRVLAKTVGHVGGNVSEGGELNLKAKVLEYNTPAGTPKSLNQSISSACTLHSLGDNGGVVQEGFTIEHRVPKIVYPEVVYLYTTSISSNDASIQKSSTKVNHYESFTKVDLSKQAMANLQKCRKRRRHGPSGEQSVVQLHDAGYDSGRINIGNRQYGNPEIMFTKENPYFLRRQSTSSLNSSTPSGTTKASGRLVNTLDKIVYACVGQYPSGGHYKEHEIILNFPGTYCENKGSCHSTPGIYVIIDSNLLSMTQKCFKSNCSRQNGNYPMWNFRRLNVGKGHSGAVVQSMRGILNRMCKASNESSTEPKNGFVNVCHYTSDRLMNVTEFVDTMVTLLYYHCKTTSHPADELVSQTTGHNPQPLTLRERIKNSYAKLDCCGNKIQQKPDSLFDTIHLL